MNVSFAHGNGKECHGAQKLSGAEKRYSEIRGELLDGETPGIGDDTAVVAYWKNASVVGR